MPKNPESYIKSSKKSRNVRSSLSDLNLNNLSQRESMVQSDSEYMNESIDNVHIPDPYSNNQNSLQKNKRNKKPKISEKE